MSAELPKDRRAALLEARRVIYERLKTFSLTEEMLRDKSLFQLVNLLHFFLGHRNYVGTFTGTCGVLEEIFGVDAFWDKPVGKNETESESKVVVN